jgi:hypothetical protein
MKDLGGTCIMLGINISRTSDGLVLPQSHYVDKVFDKFFKGEIVL